MFVLNKNNFEKESNHNYSDEIYLKLIKHELAHIFFSKLSNGRNKPVWLSEGVSIYASNQLKNKKKPEAFKNFLKFGEKKGKGVYEESGFVVELLVNKFKKEKLLNLIKNLSKANSEDSFKALFKEIYGFELNYENINKLKK